MFHVKHFCLPFAVKYFTVDRGHLRRGAKDELQAGFSWRMRLELLVCAESLREPINQAAARPADGADSRRHGRRRNWARRFQGDSGASKIGKHEVHCDPFDQRAAGYPARAARIPALETGHRTGNRGARRRIARHPGAAPAKTGSARQSFSASPITKSRHTASRISDKAELSGGQTQPPHIDEIHRPASIQICSVRIITLDSDRPGAPARPVLFWTHEQSFRARARSCLRPRSVLRSAVLAVARRNCGFFPCAV